MSELIARTLASHGVTLEDVKDHRVGLGEIRRMVLEANLGFDVFRAIVASREN